jgi:4-hydroxybenzoate polyprenyltransferase
MTARHVIRLLRPRHWVKNVFVLAPMVFAGKALEGRAWALAGLGFGAFCLLSSATYAINDVVDAETDRTHPNKKQRPVASGEMSRPQALAVALVCLALGVTMSLPINARFLLVGMSYFFLNLLYTGGLKQVLVMDVACIALGFVLRAAAGGEAVGAPASAWLLVCTMCLCMFLGFAKRRSDIAGTFTSRAAERALPPYTAALLDRLIGASAAVTLVAYMAYTMDPATVRRFGTPCFIFSVPLVAYAVWRVRTLVETGRASGPTEAVTEDPPLIASLILWALYAGLIATRGPQVQAALETLIGALPGK